METILSIIGSIASIGSAIWAYLEAKSARKSASRAEKIKTELIKRREIIEVSSVHREVTRILQVVSKVGPSCTRTTLRGVKNDAIAKDVEEFSRFLNEHSRHFTDLFDNKAKSLCSSLQPLIEQLSEAEGFEPTKNVGKNIYYLINSFMPEVKKLADGRREDVPIA